MSDRRAERFIDQSLEYTENVGAWGDDIGTKALVNALLAIASALLFVGHGIWRSLNK